jgi:hypothetical protein
VRPGVEFFQRGRRGWAPSDTWSLDHYLAGVMGESLHRLAESGKSWPGLSAEWPTQKAWADELHRHAAVLSAYSTDWESKVEVGPSLHRLASIWGDLWD